MGGLFEVIGVRRSEVWKWGMLLISLSEAGILVVCQAPGTARPCGRSLTLGFRKHSLFEAFVEFSDSDGLQVVIGAGGQWCVFGVSVRTLI